MKDQDHKADHQAQPQEEAAAPKASAIERLGSVPWEDRARILRLMGDVFPLMEIVELSSPGSQRKLQRLLADDDWRSVMVVFKYKA
jgi:hypothetical protein